MALPSCPPAQISALPAVLAAHAGLGVLAVIVGEGSTPGSSSASGAGDVSGSSASDTTANRRAPAAGVVDGGEPDAGRATARPGD
jgi:hypothetical protein